MDFSSMTRQERRRARFGGYLTGMCEESECWGCVQMQRWSDTGRRAERNFSMARVLFWRPHSFGIRARDCNLSEATDVGLLASATACALLAHRARRTIHFELPTDSVFFFPQLVFH